MPCLLDSVSPRHLAALVQFLEKDGLSCDAALRKAGLTRGLLEMPLVPIASVMAAMQELVRSSRRTDLGFVRGLLTQVGTDHVAGQLLLNAGTLREGLTMLSPYMPLVSPVVRMQCRNEPGRFVVEWSMARPMPYDMSIIALETMAVSSHRQLLFMLQEQQISYELEFFWPAPEHAARYRELKSPRVRYSPGGAPRVVATLPADIADAPLPMADARILHRAGMHAHSRLQELARERSFLEWVRHVLSSADDEMLTQDDVARLLRVSARTLSRHLGRENSRFGQISQQVRQSRAEGMLGGSACSIGDIAHRLGYSTAANFCRAFKANSGATPGEFRSKHPQTRQPSETPEGGERTDLFLRTSG
jgi:AraC-like DNA-binding protein